MTDADLACALVPDDPAKGAIIAARLSPQKRSTYEALIHCADEINAGRVPPGVMVCRPSCGCDTTQSQPEQPA